jgi:predicted  nucleic acid-binding Zn-ribbon protein
MLPMADVMNQAANIMQSLRDLARLDADLRKLPEGTPEYDEHKKKMALLRRPLPTSILSHYDKRLTQGKVGVAPVRRGVCGACYIGLPSGRLADLRRKPQELNVCDHCGAFIYLDESEVPPLTSVASATPARKAPKTKRLQE